MKKQVCSSLLALTMTLGTVTPALAAETENNVQSAACTCTAACTEETRNMDCAVCGAEGAPLTDCAQVNAQDDTNNEQQTANAENGFEYTVTGDEATITGYTGSAKSLVIPSELGGKPVTEIGIFAFALCGSLTEVTIPEGVTSIGNSAFSSCSSLTKVTIPKSVTSIGNDAFAHCSSLTKVTIPEGVTSIGAGAFQSCGSLTEVTIPKSVETIGEIAFDECEALATVYYGGSQEDWDALKNTIDNGNNPLLNATIMYTPQESDFTYTENDTGVTITGYTGSTGNIIIPSELGGKPVTAIGEDAFYKNKTITSVKIPEGVTSIGKQAFFVCSSLKEVRIPEGVTSIGNSAFAQTNLTEVEIPKSVKNIERYAFNGCGNLEEVTIPGGVQSTGNNAFAYCSRLKQVIISDGVEIIGGSAFYGCSSLTEVTIPKSVTSIEYAAFYDCGALATVYYGGTQEDWDALKKNIGDNNTPLLNANIICAIQESNGFEYTVTGDEATITGYTGSAENIVIPSELGGKPVTAIADKAFEGYKNIVNLYIPKTIKAIGEDAFQNATSNLIRFICYEGTENEWANIAIQKGNEELNPREFDDVAWFRLYECNLSGDMVYQASDDAATLVRYFGSDSKVDIPAELGGKPVTEIGEWAFAYCSSLTEVTIPKSVTSIRAFAFRSCSSLTKVIIPEGVTSIGESAFQSCGSLTEVTIPKSVTSIESFAFCDCEALKTVYYGGTQKDWDALKKNIGEENAPLLNANIICAIQESNGFEYTVTGDEATITGYTGSARSLVIPSELGGKPVTAIADKAFYGYKTPNIYIPKTIKAIGEDAFEGTVLWDEVRFICYEGTENEWANIAIQKGNEELNPREFDDVAWFRLYECNLSGDMVYQASDDAATLVRYFGSDSKVDIPAELGGKPVTSIGKSAFEACSSLTEVTIPKSVTSIGEFAFESCSSLTKVIIAEGVTSIGRAAFGHCSSLTEVTIPEGVTNIEMDTFHGCSSLTEVTIPKSVTSIGEMAFYDCGALATVYYGGTQKDWDALKKNIGDNNTPLLNANIICKEKPKICKGGKEVKISNGAHEMRIHGKSYGTFTFVWVNDKAGWSIQNADGKYLSFDNGKLVLRDTAYVWKYDAKFYTKTEEKTSSGWGWWGRPSTKVTNWYLVGDGTDLSISKSDTNADVKLYDAMESTEHSFGKWTPAEDGKHTRTCTICGATETGDCTYENGACTVCGALDPDNASVSVSATVTKRTSGGGGWWWWNRPTTTTWEARITATGTGVDIDKVEYSDDGKHYLTGTSFTSDTEITKFYIRVTDSKGNVTKWLYENGKVTQK